MTLIVAVVLLYLSGLSNVAIGILVLLSRYDVSAGDVLPVSLLGAGIILFGLLTVAIGSALARGSRLSRVLVTISLGIQFVLQTITIVMTDDWAWSAAVEILLQVYVLIALWTPPGSRRFRLPES